MLGALFENVCPCEEPILNTRVFELFYLIIQVADIWLLHIHYQYRLKSFTYLLTYLLTLADRRAVRSPLGPHCGKQLVLHVHL